MIGWFVWRTLGPRTLESMVAKFPPHLTELNLFTWQFTVRGHLMNWGQFLSYEHFLTYSKMFLLIGSLLIQYLDTKFSYLYQILAWWMGLPWRTYLQYQIKESFSVFPNSYEIQFNILRLPFFAILLYDRNPRLLSSSRVMECILRNEYIYQEKYEKLWRCIRVEFMKQNFHYFR